MRAHVGNVWGAGQGAGYSRVWGAGYTGLRVYAEAVAAPEATRRSESENVDGRHRLSSRLPVGCHAGCSTGCSRGPLAGMDHVAPLPGGD